MKDERLVSKMEGKTDFSRRLKQFDGLRGSAAGRNFLAPSYYSQRAVFASL